MAKKKPSDERRILGKTRAELRRELGLDELTREACIRDLFAELLEDDAPGFSAARVVQTGPGRRRGPGEGGDDDADPT